MAVSISDIKSIPELKDIPLNKVTKIISLSNLLRCSKISFVSRTENSMEIEFKIDYQGSGLKNYHGSPNRDGSNESLERTLFKVPDVSSLKISIPNNIVRVTIQL